MEMINAKKQAPLEIQIPKEDGWFEFDMRNNTTNAQSVSPPTQGPQKQHSQQQNPQHQTQNQSMEHPHPKECVSILLDINK